MENVGFHIELILHHCLTNWSHTSWLQTTLSSYLTVFVCQKSRWGCLGPLFRVLQSQNQDVHRTVLLTGGSEKEPASKLIQISAYRFLAATELRSPFPCWISAEGWFLILGACIPSHAFHVAFSSNSGSSSSVTLWLSLPSPSAAFLWLFWLPSASKGSCYYIEPTQIIQDNLF